MGFTSIIFLFYFLPLVILFHAAAPKKIRSLFFLASSYLFYLWGSPTGAVILFASSIVDYLLAGSIGRTRRPGTKKLLLGLSVSINIIILIYFKYANFFIGEINGVLNLLNMAAIPWKDVIFPLGISFITFHKISYLTDIYYGTAKPAESFTAYALYLAMFPKLLQGPIMRYNTISGEIVSHAGTLDSMFQGCIRFCVGLAKKVLIADALGHVVDAIFRLDSSSLTVGLSWIGVVFYSFQIYFDFTGYTDMAIGIGRMFGFTFTENFNRPYISQTFTEYWRRWHITLGNWFREYLYIPLGGNRAGRFNTYRNLWIVFIVTGLWHGANWTFIIWGLFHGLFIFLDRIFWLKITKRIPVALNIALTYFLLLVGWVFFRSDTIGGALYYLGRMFDFTKINNMPTTIMPASIIGNREIFVVVLAAILSFFPDSWFVQIKDAAAVRMSEGLITGLKAVSAAVLFVLSLVSIINSSFNPFIYFRF
ncbi:MAG: hypothetical protein A2176_06785 [Spirochaetes bacterium RBG_13_51_14]|nr:MAG: hypothetical protein A2176_06785 [Spirochaetes bacterium RBG_13_51_14]